MALSTPGGPCKGGPGPPGTGGSGSARERERGREETAAIRLWNSEGEGEGEREETAAIRLWTSESGSAGWLRTQSIRRARVRACVVRGAWCVVRACVRSA